MNKIAIIECFNNSAGAKNGNTTIAHIKNNKIIADYIGCDYFIDTFDLDIALADKWDTLVFTSSSFFAEHDKIKQILENNKNARKLYITNDWKTCVPSELNKFDYEVISNFRPKNNKRKHYSLNLNCLMAREPLPVIEKKFDCIYWGACRQDRVNYFKEYLKGDIYLSTTAKAKKKFIEAGCTPKIAPQIDWNKSLTHYFRYSLYIEDNWIHNNFHNLANRWYEAGIYNNVTFFDKDCMNTIAQSEIAEVFDKYYLVNGYNDLQNKINETRNNFAEHLARQKEWHKIDLITKAKVLSDIKTILEV